MKRIPNSLILATLLVAFALALWPLPGSLAYFRPNWLALVLCYWLLESPDRSAWVWLSCSVW